MSIARTFTALLRSIVRKCESFLSGVVAIAAVFFFTYPLESAMMVFSDYQKQRILYYGRLGESHAEIAHRLTEEGRRATNVGVLKFLRWYEQTGTHFHKPGNRKASKITDNAKRIIEEQMNKDNKTTGCELQKLLSKDGITSCASIALTWRQQLGWTSKGTSYCQMIWEVNKEKRLASAIKNKDMFWEDVLYTDETTV